MFISTLYRDEFKLVERQAGGGGLETVNKPRIITDYSRYMSRVNKADQLMVYNACGRKSLKWYTRIFWCMLDHTILNARKAGWDLGMRLRPYHAAYSLAFPTDSFLQPWPFQPRLALGTIQWHLSLTEIRFWSAFGMDIGVVRVGFGQHCCTHGS